MSSKRILIVEDDKVARGAIQMILGWYGAEITVASDVRTGMAALDHKYDAIAADIMLPGDGTGGIGLLREAARRRSAPTLVVMTGASDPDLLAEARELCHGNLLRKPLDPPELLAALGVTSPAPNAP